MVTSRCQPSRVEFHSEEQLRVDAALRAWFAARADAPPGDAAAPNACAARRDDVRIGACLRLAIAALLAVLAVSPAGAATAIMPLGDSLTAGAYSGTDPSIGPGIGGYRAPLWTRLVQEGYVVDYVGSVSGPAPAGVDPDHEGHGGWRIDDLQNSVDGWLATYRPDVILLCAGANDLIQGHGVDTAATRMTSLLARIRADRPGAVVLLGNLIPVPQPNYYNYDLGQIQAFNARLPAIVAAAAQQGQAIELVDLYRCGITDADYNVDGVHPNAAGYAKMAAGWHDPLARRLVATPPYTPPPPSGTFVRGVNLGGGAITIDGNAWDAGSAANVAATGSTFAATSVPLNPPTGTARAAMIHDSAYDFAGSNVRLSGVAAGAYGVYLYVWEDNDSETVDILVDGAVVVSGYRSGGAGHWDRLGPFASSAPGGAIAVTTRGGVLNLSGIEIWRTDSTQPPPPGEFWRGVNLGGDAVTIDGHAWEAGNAADVVATGGTFAAPNVALDPATDAARAAMIHDSAYDFAGSNVRLTNVPAAGYAVYLYVWEDNDPETVDILVDGAVVRSGYRSGSAGHWDRLGPFASSAPGGAIAVTTRGGVLNLSGIEVWRTGDAPPPPPPTNAIALHPDNHRYFLFRGQPTVLITSGEHYGAVLNLDFDYATYLDAIQAAGLNMTRLFAGDYAETWGDGGINTLNPAPGRFIAPWARSNAGGYADGGNRFELNAFDPAYWARLRDFVQRASDRGIVVEYSLFCTTYGDAEWGLSPFNAANNVDGLTTDRDQLWNVGNASMMAIEDAFVRKAVTELNGFDNVTYELCNEPVVGSYPGRAWHDHMAALIAATEASLPNRHLVAYNIDVGWGSGYLPAPIPNVDIYNFHYAFPPDVVATDWALDRPIAFDENGFRNDPSMAAYRQEAWAFLLNGGAVYDGLDWSFTVRSPDGRDTMSAVPTSAGGAELRGWLRVLRGFMGSLDLARLGRDPGVIAGGVPGSAWALTAPGTQVAVYLLGGTRADLALNLPAGAWRADWIDTRTGAVAAGESFAHGGGVRTLSSPAYDQDIALRVVRTGSGDGGGGTVAPGWSDADIGPVGAAGSASYAEGAWTVRGSGDDIWNGADAFRFVSEPLSGDAQIVARVASQTDTDAWAKAGVMIRESPAPGSRHAFMALTPGNGLAFQRRVESDGASSHTAGAPAGAPAWVKLVRTGDVFAGYESADGATWTLVGSATIAMGVEALVGLAVTSHNNGAVSTAVFDNVAIVAAPSGGG